MQKKSQGQKCGGEGKLLYTEGGIGETLELEFDGSVFAVEHGLHDDCAGYDVYIDGNKAGTGNAYQKGFVTNQLVMGFNTFDLTYGHHTVKIVNVKNETKSGAENKVRFYSIITGKKTEV